MKEQAGKRGRNVISQASCILPAAASGDCFRCSRRPVGGVERASAAASRRFAQRSGYRKTLCATFLISYPRDDHERIAKMPKANESGGSNSGSHLTIVPRRAVLIFADEAHVDLARRAFPNAARPLLNPPKLGPELSPGTDVHLFTSSRGFMPRRAQIHRQDGHDFASRLENAIEKIHQLGYDEIVAIGRDCPSLCARDIEHAFADLESRKLVLGPDHRGGCYLIAFRLRDRDLLRGVRWKQDTDCAELRGRCLSSEVCLLPVKHDLDSWADVRLFARSGDPLARLAAFLLRVVCGSNTAVTQFVDLAWQRVRVRQQMPPPAFAI